MKIRVPRERAYYPASRNEPDRLLCWLPPEDLQELVRQGRAQDDILDYYPSGLEVEVTRQGLEEFRLDLGATPEALQEAYQTLRQQDALPKSGMVAGASLEEITQAPAKTSGSEKSALSLEPGKKLRSPEMTKGADPRSVMRQLSR
jgi:hypothetical protein